MPDNPASKQNKQHVRIDPEKKEIYIPGHDSPKELISPITQRIDKHGQPYQHVASTGEMIEAQERQVRMNRLFERIFESNWKCTQCGQVISGKKLNPSPQLTGMLTQILGGAVRVGWKEITDHIHEHLRCPDEKCKAPCVPVEEAPAP